MNVQFLQASRIRWWLVSTIGVFSVCGSLVSVAADIWQDIPVAKPAIGVVANEAELEYYSRELQADLALLQSVLAEAPQEYTSSHGALLTLPMPDGSFQRFRIERSSTMAPELAEQFPDIQTYKGHGVDHPSAVVSLDMTPQGFHAMVSDEGRTIFIDPTSVKNSYRSYYRQDLYTALKGQGRHVRFQCGVIAGSQEPALTPAAKGLSSFVAARSGSQLRVYRLAVAATGEYTQRFGGTVGGALAAITTAINRVNQILVRDLSLRLELVAGNQNIIYTNANTDPYTNDNGPVLLSENQANIDAVIGNGNYDIGHVFATESAGLAVVKSACAASYKAQGTTGVSNPIGDAFYIDYVAHELGHQLGANHSFNGTNLTCGDSRNPLTAYEPGSGSTIMAYAGLCGSEDVENFSDATFHAGSIAEILQFTVNGSGASCLQVGPNNGNSPPVANAGVNYAIPSGTAFTLFGAATDPDAQVLTYQWDQMDSGSATNKDNYGTDLGSNTLFRSYLPSGSASRTFPKLTTLLNGATDKSETLPTTTRTLTFRLTARDNTGGVDEDDVTLFVDATAGPFYIVQPTTSLTLDNSKPQKILWNVANTHAATINCSQVDILLSTNSGNDFSTILTAATDNDGEAVINLPAINTHTARIKLSCSDNIFFDISNTDFQIATNSGTALTGAPPPITGSNPSSVSTPKSGGGGGAIGLYSLLMLMGLGLFSGVVRVRVKDTPAA